MTRGIVWLESTLRGGSGGWFECRKCGWRTAVCRRLAALTRQVNRHRKAHETAPRKR